MQSACNQHATEPLDILYLTRDAVARVPALKTLAHLWEEGRGAIVSVCMQPALKTLAHLRLRREHDLDCRRRWTRPTKGAHELTCGKSGGAPS